jgi:hypothetical protein
MDEQELVRHWLITPPADEKGKVVFPRTHYGLRNLVIERSLRYGEREWGINLEWDRAMRLGNISFERSSESRDPIRYDEPIAILIKRDKDSAYLRYETRRFGINLSWSSGPLYEWKLGGGKPGDHVDISKSVSLYSMVEKDYLVYCERPLGINLRWQKDKESEGCREGWEKLVKVIVDKGIDLASK